MTSRKLARTRLSVALSAVLVSLHAHAQTAPEAPPSPAPESASAPAAAASEAAGDVVNAPVPAQPAAAPAVTLPPVVVTAVSARDQAVRTAPASITVITRDEIAKRTETSVPDLLRTVEGVSVVGSSPNDLDISLRGMPGDNTLLLIDGQRLSTRETMNRGTGGVQPKLLPPLAAIERIEVVRGPMSSLYGADALGGVINIVTRKLPAQWSGALNAYAIQQTHDELGDSRGGDFWLGGPLVGDVLGLQIWGSTSRRDEDDFYIPANATSGANGQRDKSLNLKLSARVAEGQSLSLDLGKQQVEYLTTPGLSIADVATAATVLETRHGRENWGLTHDGAWAWGRSTLMLYGETGTQEQWVASGQTTVEPKVRNTTLEGRAVLPWLEGANTLTVGAQLRKQELDGVAAQDAVPAGLPRNPDTITRDSWALYGENDYQATREFILTLGLRMDHDEHYGAHFSPRLYGVYELDAAWTLRGGIASGFKAPTLRQSTDGYCMTTGGAAGANPGTLCGNPDLDPETSVTAEAGVRWDGSHGDYANLTVYDSRIKNRVASYDTGVPDPRTTGRSIYVYDNISRVDIYGAELGFSSALGAGWRLAGNYTYTHSQRKGGGETAFNGSSLDGMPLDKTPEHKAYLRAEWQAIPALGFFGAIDYEGKQYWSAFRNGAMSSREREATTTFDVGGRWTIVPGIDLKFAVLNATDERVDVDTRTRAGGLSGNWMLDEGRRYSLSLAAQF